GAVMMLEDRLHLRSDDDLLMGVSQEIADHAYISRMRQFDDSNDIGAGILQRGMNGMPDAGPAVDHPLWSHLRPFKIKCLRVVGNPLGRPLIGTGAGVPLDDELFRPRPF